MSFGFDEETKGSEGALQLSRRIEEIYGKDGVALILDEGAGFTELYGQTFAYPGIAEKGIKYTTHEVSEIDVSRLLGRYYHCDYAWRSLFRASRSYGKFCNTRMTLGSSCSHD